MAINVPSVSPSQAKEIISLLEPLGVSVMLWGPPGVGKSDIVDQIARDRDGELIDLRLSHKIASDVGGLPMVDRETKTTVFAKPSWFPAEDAGSPTVLFLDELAGADEHTRIAAYGLLLERRVDAWKLPNNCQVVAASNRTEDGAISAEFGTALNDRLVHLVVEPNLDDWIVWATDHDVHPAIVAFLKSHPHRLIASMDEINEGNAVLPSPRSWKRASDALKLIDAKKGISPVTRTATIAGILGMGVAAEFWAVYDEVFGLPSIHDLLEAAKNDPGKLFSMMPKNVSGLFAMGFGLASVIQRENAESVMRVILALQESSMGLGSGEGMAFAGTLVCEAAERRRLHDAMMLCPSYDRYSAIMRNLRAAA
jgi:hypothetical protein